MGTPAEVKDNHPVILFDGVCNLCNASVQFIIKRDPAEKFRFASLQSSYAKSLLAPLGLDPEKELFSIILVEQGRLYRRSDAALRIARQLTGLWPIVYALKIIPRFVRDSVYNWIARNRYRFFGKKDECMIPTPSLKMRFLG